YTSSTAYTGRAVRARAGGALDQGARRDRYRGNGGFVCHAGTAVGRIFRPRSRACHSLQYHAERRILAHRRTRLGPLPPCSHRAGDGPGVGGAFPPGRVLAARLSRLAEGGGRKRRLRVPLFALRREIDIRAAPPPRKGLPGLAERTSHAWAMDE